MSNRLLNFCEVNFILLIFLLRAGTHPILPSPGKERSTLGASSLPFEGGLGWVQIKVLVEKAYPADKTPYGFAPRSQSFAFKPHSLACSVCSLSGLYIYPLLFTPPIYPSVRKSAPAR